MSLTKEQNDFILKLYHVSGGRAETALEKFEDEYGFSITCSTIRRRWKDAGFELQNHGGKRHGLDESEFRSLYTQYKGNIDLMARNSYSSESYLVRLCHKYDLEPRNISEIKKSHKKRNINYFHVFDRKCLKQIL